MIYIVCGVLLVIIILTIGLDFFAGTKKYIQQRFFQGRILNANIWAQKVKSICKKWLLKTPKVSPSDEKVYKIVEILKRKKTVRSIQVWQQSSLYLGLDEVYKKTQDSSLKQVLDKFKQDVKIKEINDADYGILAYALMDENGQGVLNAEMLKYVETNKTQEGLIYYKKYATGSAFVDTLGFVCPFLIKYGLKNQNQGSIDLALHQLELYFQYGIETHSNLPFHAFSIENKTHLGICDWARGLAWLLIALMDSYRCFLEEQKENEFLKEKIKEYADILLKYQKTSGAFSWQLFSGNKPSDSSATAVFGWYLACCRKIFKEDKYTKSAVRAREYLMSVTYNNGVIDYAQGDTISIGMYSRRFEKMPFAQGFALRLQTEISNEGVEE